MASVLSRWSSIFSWKGQSMLEYAVLIAAVTSAVVVMSGYVQQAFSAHTKAIEVELNGATQDNQP